jgi:hypothetical protein
MVSMCKIRDVRGASAALQAKGPRLNWIMSTHEELAARKTCMAVLFDEMDRTPQETGSEELHDYSARAIASLESYNVTLNGDKSDSERRFGASGRQDGYNAEASACHEQDKRLRTQLPRFAWETANECISAISAEASRWLYVGDKEFLSEAVYHILEVALVNRFNNVDNRRMSSNMDLASPEFWRLLIRSGGGARYFMAHGVATGMVYHFSAINNAIQGRGGDLGVFANPLLIKRLRKPCGIWTDWHQPTVIALAHIPPHHRESFVAGLAARDRAMRSVYEYAEKQRKATTREAGLLEKQAAGLRKRLTTAEATTAQVQASNRVLQASLRVAASKTAACVIPAEEQREVEGYNRLLREKDADLERLRDSLTDTNDELGRTRELLNVVLEPSPAAALEPDEARPSERPEDWRIVFVGGHQRLHSKLRKKMRNAVFLHPDQSQFSPEVFKGADAVVFSIGYCSHALAYRAANEVRRGGLRAGYSNFANVEMVLDEIRAVLFPSNHLTDQRPT